MRSSGAGAEGMTKNTQRRRSTTDVSHIYPQKRRRGHRERNSAAAEQFPRRPARHAHKHRNPERGSRGRNVRCERHGRRPPTERLALGASGVQGTTTTTENKRARGRDFARLLFFLSLDDPPSPIRPAVDNNERDLQAPHWLGQTCAR